MRTKLHMGGALRRAALYAVPMALAVVVLSFFLLQHMQGDAADVYAAEAGVATAEGMAQVRAHFGLDQPLHVQLGRYLFNLAHFDLGMSPRHNMPVSTLVLDRLGNTLLLMLTALAIALALGVFFGVVMAVRVGRWPDKVLSVIALLLYSTPSFWVGLMAIMVFSVKLGWFPVGGDMTIGANLTGWAYVADRLHYLVLPALTVAGLFIAIFSRLTRAAMLEVSTQDFVRTAQAKGLSPAAVTIKHILRNALIPVTTVAGMHFGALLGGAIVVEVVFSWPGLGRLAMESVTARDHNVLLAILLFSSLLVIAANVVVDLLHTWLDPRIARR